MLVARPAELVPRSRRYVIGRGLCGPHVGALGLAAGAFCQTYVPFSVDTATVPASTNKRARSQVLISEFSSTDLCVLPRERRLRGLTIGKKDRSDVPWQNPFL